MSDLVYIQNDDTDFVSLSSASSLKLSRTVKGKLFKKHILSTGPLYYPGITGGKVDVDQAFLSSVVRNFENKVRPIVQVPVVGDDNEHTENPDRNIGEVVALTVEGNKLYSIIDVRDETAVPKMGKTYLGASALLSLNALDNRTGVRAGPTLIHTVITNNPHVNELDDFEEFLAASSSDSSSDAVILTASLSNTKEQVMDLDTLIATLRDEHNIDVPALQRKEAEADQFAALSASLQEKLTGSELLKLSSTDETPSSEDILVAVTNIIDTNLELSSKVDALVQKNARTEVEALVDEKIAGGFITPAKRDAYITLALSNRDSFDEIVSDTPVVELDAESGKQVLDETPDATIEDEIARLSATAEKMGISIKA